MKLNDKLDIKREAKVTFTKGEIRVAYDINDKYLSMSINQNHLFYDITSNFINKETLNDLIEMLVKIRDGYNP